MAQLAPMMQLRARFEDKCGHPLAGGSVFAFEVGTSTPKDTFKDADGTIPNTHPIKLDYRGEADIYLLSGRYRFVVYSCHGVKIYDVDNVGEWLGPINAENVFDGNKNQHQINEEQAEKNIALSQEITDSVKNEQDRALLAETNLQTSISNESTRATDAEANLNLKIDSETQRAQTAEQNLQVQITTGNAGIKYFSTEAELLAFVPAASDPKQAYAFDTKKNYLWKLKSGSTTEYEWKDEGVSQLDQAKQYTDAKAILEAGSDLAILKDINGKTVFLIKKNGKFYIVGLPNDIASCINTLNSLIYTSNSSNLIESFDLNGRPSLTQNKFGDLILPNIGNLTLALKALKNDVSSQNSLNLPAAHISGKYADYVLTEAMPDFEHTDYLLKASDVNALNIFPHAVTMLRIPAITRIGKSKYLLFFEARENSSDFGMNSQGVATVDINETTGVATISNVQCLHAAFTDSENKLRTFMNACAVKCKRPLNPIPIF
ncbi:hypothetical protein [Acinetobacter baumannii]